MKLSTIMVVHGCHERANEALRAARRALEPVVGSYEAVVADTEGTSSASFRPAEGSAVSKVIKCHGNLGFARAANRAVQASRGSYLLFLNPDVFVLDNGARQLFLAAEARNGAGIFGARLHEAGGADAAWGGVFHYRLRRAVGKLLPSFRRPSLPARGIVPVDWVAATAAIVGRAYFEQVDGFAEEYYMYFEDVDFCARLARCGIPSFVVADAVFIHQGGGSYRSYPAERRSADYQVSRNTFFRKHAPWRGHLLRALLDLMGIDRYNRRQ